MDQNSSSKVMNMVGRYQKMNTFEMGIIQSTALDIELYCLYIKCMISRQHMSDIIPGTFNTQFFLIQHSC